MRSDLSETTCRVGDSVTRIEGIGVLETAAVPLRKHIDPCTFDDRELPDRWSVSPRRAAFGRARVRRARDRQVPPRRMGRGPGSARGGGFEPAARLDPRPDLFLSRL